MRICIELLLAENRLLSRLFCMANVVHLLTYLDSQTGGMERQALALSTRLRAKGHRIFFITCIHISEMCEKKLRVIGTIGGFRVYRVPLIPWLRKLNALLYFFGALTILIWTRRRYSIIHAHQMYSSGVVACIAKILLPKRRVLVKNCCGGECGDVKYLRALPLSHHIIEMMKRHIDTFIAISGETHQEMERTGFCNVVRIPNGVDTKRFSPSNSSKDSLKRELYPELSSKTWVLFVGKFDPQKNSPLLIEAAAELPDDACLLIVGAGAMSEQIESMIRSRRLGERVILCGTTTNIEKYYQSADLFVLPSRAEGSPNVLLEAMSSGLPCIGSDIASISEVVEHEKNGLIFGKYDKVDALQKCLRSALSDPEQMAKLGHKARQTILERYSFKAIVKRYSDFYDSYEVT